MKTAVVLILSLILLAGALAAKGEGDKRLYSFVLNDKDIGGCSDDNLSRSNAPYREKVELRQQGHIGLSEPQVTRFNARFRHGFSGRPEGFGTFHG